MPYADKELGKLKASERYLANRDVRLAKMKEYANRPEVKAATAARQKEYYSRPEIKARVKIYNSLNRDRDKAREAEYNSRPGVKERVSANREKSNERARKRFKERRIVDPSVKELDNLRMREYRKSNKAKTKLWPSFLRRGPEYRDKINARRRERMASDVNYRIKERLRARLRDCIKRSLRSGSAVDKLGCTIEWFKSYMSSKFLPGMSWDNWSRTGWHIDHIKPLSLFDLTDPDQLSAACHYSNLQPLWAKDNHAKGNRVAA